MLTQNRSLPSTDVNALKAAVLRDKKGERSSYLKERENISLREERKRGRKEGRKEGRKKNK